ncbi:MAG: hypothetical protein ACXVEF_25495 [Polyangiales bacterium]
MSGAKGELIALELTGADVVGEIAMTVPPGTVAAERDRAVDALLGPPLHELARGRGVVVAASASAFAKPRDGKDDTGRMHFDVRGRVEGDRLVPVRKAK